MTREEAKKLLPIIKAFSDGETIQHLDIINDKWEDVDEFVYHGSVKSYRIKPEQKYRPFKDAGECWNEMQKHQPFGWVSGNNCFYNIVSVSNIDVSMANVSGDIVTLNFSDVIEDNTFADGATFGVKVEE